MKKVIVARGRNFICHYNAIFGGKMCDVSIWEIVRPTWKIFRCKYRDGFSFWIENYETIAQGVEKAVYLYLAKEDREKAIIEKWKREGK